MVERFALRITIDGKRVWPPPGRKGWLDYEFKQQEDGTVVYVEYPVRGNGEPDKEHPQVVVEIDKRQADRLLLRLGRTKLQKPDSPKERLARGEMVEMMKKLDRVSAANKNGD